MVFIVICCLDECYWVALHRLYCSILQCKQVMLQTDIYCTIQYDHMQVESVWIQSFALTSYFFTDREAVWNNTSQFPGWISVYSSLLMPMLLYVAGVQVLQYEEEFRQLFVLTLSKLKQVNCLLLAWSKSLACFLKHIFVTLKLFVTELLLLLSTLSQDATNALKQQLHVK